MPFTDQDEADLKAIASKKAGMFSSEYGRQFRGKKASEPTAEPTDIFTKTLSRRESEAGLKSTDDPTHVHFGGNPGSSVRREDE